MTGRIRKATANRIRAALQRALLFCAQGWQLLRRLSGDDAYERYLEHSRHHATESAPLDRRGFYLREQERRFSGGPTSCC
jgi:uncharacterized short protein YbdD (DUF466 family)